MTQSVEERLAKLNEEYDLSDLAANDRMQLVGLAEAMTQLDQYTALLNRELDQEDDDINISRIKNLQRLISDARKDISSISDDLKISRKIREKSEEDLTTYIASLKERAANFLEDRLSYIYCTECKTLVATMWLLDYNKGGKSNFVCSKCGQSFLVVHNSLEKRKNVDDALVPKTPT
jgi:chromosome segregation ATPase